jgi:hypothetical protein
VSLGAPAAPHPHWSHPQFCTWWAAGGGRRGRGRDKGSGQQGQQGRGSVSQRRGASWAGAVQSKESLMGLVKAWPCLLPDRTSHRHPLQGNATSQAAADVQEGAGLYAGGTPGQAQQQPSARSALACWCDVWRVGVALSRAGSGAHCGACRLSVRCAEPAWVG